MKKGTVIFLYILFSIILFASALVIDYSVSKIYGRRPVFAIKHVNDKEQYTVYNGLFYKMWICNNEINNFRMGKEDKDAPVCHKIIILDENNEFINSNNIKITQKEYTILNPYYTYDLINEFATEEEVNNALLIAKEIHEKDFTTKEGYTVIHNKQKLNIAIFKEFVETQNGIFEWRRALDNEEYHYCFKYNSDQTEYLFSKYNNGTCEEDFKELVYPENWCQLLKENKISSFIEYKYKSICK